MNTLAEVSERNYATRYALEWQCPDMLMFGFKVITAHGSLEIEADEAPLIVAAMKQILTERLAALNATLNRAAEAALNPL
jgi:hypothetical protein